MEDLSLYTPTELLKLINENKDKHEAKKKEIIEILGEIEKWEKLVNENLSKLGDIENKYVSLIEELNKR